MFFVFLSKNFLAKFLLEKRKKLSNLCKPDKLDFSQKYQVVLLILGENVYFFHFNKVYADIPIL